VNIPGTVDVAKIEQRIAAVERTTGAQVVVAIVGRSDRYPEAKWRAFALGVALAALAVVLFDVGQRSWLPLHGGLASSAIILASGALFWLAAHYFDVVARLFVRPGRARAEVRQHAEVMFLSRELFATPGRNAILMMASRFERRLVIVPDVAYRGKVGHAEWEGVIAATAPGLRGYDAGAAFLDGLAALETLLLGKGFTGPGDKSIEDAFLHGEDP
jgi:putative membrane protein